MKLMILDGNSIMNRAFYGVKLLATKSGIYTNAIIGFLNIMDKMVREEKPDALCVSFDLHGPTFRHKRYDGYKATRHGMPEELAMQMPYIKKVLTAMNIPIYAVQGWEADDVIGTVGRICGERNWKCVAVTGDRDSLQLIDEHVTIKLIISKPGNTTATLYDEALFVQEYGFAPKRLVDLKALMGDSSDNIPGVPGVGKKTAGDLMEKYGSLQAVYSHLEDMKESLRSKLSAGRESAELSYELATIIPHAPISFAPEDCLIREPDKASLKMLFEELQCFNLIERYGLRNADTPEKEEIPKQDINISESFPEPAEIMVLLLKNGVMTVASGNTVYSGPIDTDYLQSMCSSVEVLLCTDYKNLLHSLKPLGLAFQGKVFDLALAGYAIDPTESSYEISKLTQRYLSKQIEQTSVEYAAAALELYPVMEREIADRGLTHIYYEIDLPLCPVLAEMEEAGVFVDKKQMLSFRDMLTARITALENEIFMYAGENFNINSPKQLGEILFDKLELPYKKKTKTGYSTNADVLEKLRPIHPIVDLILEYRQLSKLQSTYAEGLLKVIAEDGRIHTAFQNMVTATGRLSSTEPNLQNIPVRTELGAEIRKMFIAGPGCALVDADYSQIELRVLAHIADDEAMTAAFNSGADFHTVTASQVFGIPVDQVTPLMRRNAKAVNFGIVYGISKWSLSQDLNISVDEAEAYITSYLNRYSNVRKYMTDVVAQAREKGFTETAFGRKRELPDLKSSNFMVRSGAERMALNSPIQGTAADIIKIAMIKVSDALKKEYPEAKLLLQVHDELIVECPESAAEQVAKLLTEEMENAVKLNVPLVAEAKCGHTWYEAK